MILSLWKMHQSAKPNLNYTNSVNGEKWYIMILNICNSITYFYHILSSHTFITYLHHILSSHTFITYFHHILSLSCIFLYLFVKLRKFFHRNEHQVYLNSDNFKGRSIRVWNIYSQILEFVGPTLGQIETCRYNVAVFKLLPRHPTVTTNTCSRRRLSVRSSQG